MATMYSIQIYTLQLGDDLSSKNRCALRTPVQRVASVLNMLHVELHSVMTNYSSWSCRMMCCPVGSASHFSPYPLESTYIGSVLVAADTSISSSYQQQNNIKCSHQISFLPSDFLPGVIAVEIAYMYEITRILKTLSNNLALIPSLQYSWQQHYCR